MSYPDDKYCFDTISNIDVFIGLMLKTDFARIAPSIKEICHSENQCATNYWIIPKKETNSPTEAFIALFTYYFLSTMQWHYADFKKGLLGADQKPITSLLLEEFIYTKNKQIQFKHVDNDEPLTLTCFLGSLYLDITNTIDFQSDIKYKFPFVFFLELMDYPNKFMQDFTIFIETDTDYIYLTSWCSG